MSGVFTKSVPQALFDLRAAFDSRRVADLGHDWEASSKTLEDAKRILAPYETEGTVVVSDSCGLSRLSKNRPLIEVLSLVQIPKDRLYAYGSRIGGIGVGIWAADNSAMFYPARIPVRDVLGAVWEARKSMTDAAVRIGIGIRSGTFYRIGDSLYGEAYASIEEVAENETGADEIVVGEEIVRKLGDDPAFGFSERTGTARNGAFYRLERAPGGSSEEMSPTFGKYHFSLPFPRNFHRLLREFPDAKSERAQAAARYSRKKTVVLVETERHSGSDERAILEAVSADIRLRKSVRKHLRRFGGKELKTGGGISIVAFDDTGRALDFSKELVERLKSENVSCRIGVDRSDILVFDLGKRGYEVAGTAVNVASKLAQDFGKFDSVYASVDADVPDEWKSVGTPFVTEISKVELRGWRW